MNEQQAVLIISEQKEVRFYMKGGGRFHDLLNRFRDASEQQQALARILSDEVIMSLAICGSEIIGYTIILPPEQEERWSKLQTISVLGVVEVAPAFRGQTIAKRLVQAVTALPFTDKRIVVSLEYYWHWDLEMTGGDRSKYGDILKKMLQSANFEEYETTDPEIAGYPYNFMMARIGRQITRDELYAFVKLANPNAIP